MHSGVESTDWYLTYSVSVIWMSYMTTAYTLILCYMTCHMTHGKTVHHEVSMWWLSASLVVFLLLLCNNVLFCRIPYTYSLKSTWPGWKTAGSVCYKPNSLLLLLHKKSFSSKSVSKHFWYHVLSLDYVILTITITEALRLPKWSLFFNYKVMLLLCHLRVNWIQIQVM